MMPFSWTAERVEELRAMWGTHTASLIAAHFGEGCTRNAVIGKITRLGMVGKRKADEMAARKDGRLVAAQRAAAKPKPKPKPKPVIVKQEAAVVCEPVEVSHGVRIMELSPRMCVWPLGDPREDSFRYCGGLRRKSPTGNFNSVYCAEHHARAYEPPRVTRAQLHGATFKQRAA